MTIQRTEAPCTLVFTDIVLSSQLGNQHGDAYHEAWLQHNALLRELLAKWDGQEINTVGDGFYIRFDDPLQAVRWAVETLPRVRLEKWPEDIPIRVRIGMHTGVPYYDIHPGERLDFNGTPVNFASRIMGLADGRQILLSEATCDLVRPRLPYDFSLYAHGPQKLKDFGSHPVWQVVHEVLPPPGPLTSRPKKFLSAAIPPPSNLNCYPNPNFRGRNTLLDALDTHFQGSEPSPLALCGMTGLGKTLLAQEYALQNKYLYPGGVFWFNAATHPELFSDYTAVGKEYFGLYTDTAQQSGPAPFLAAMRYMEQPTLLIFDNVTADTDVRQLPHGSNLRILLTTQCQRFPEGIHRVPLPMLDREASVELLTTRKQAAAALEKKAVEEIAEILGGLPVALSQIAAAIDCNGWSFAYARERLRANLSKTLEKAREEFEANTPHTGEVFTAFARAAATLGKNAVKLMNVAACLAPHGIDPALLRTVAGVEKDDDFDAAARDLKRRWFLGYEKEDETGQQRCGVHELIQAYFRCNLTARQSQTILMTAAEELARRLRTANRSEQWAAVRQDIPHCRAVAGHGRVQKQKPVGFHRLLVELGKYFYENSNPELAVVYLEDARRCLQLHQQEDTEAYSEVLRELGAACQEAGKPDQARDLMHEALERAGKVLPGRSARIAEYYNAVGYILRRQSLFPRALSFYTEARKIYQEVHGENHAAVAMCLNNIGVVLEEESKQEDGTFEAGKLQDALNHFQKALDIEKKVSGPHHTKVAIKLNNKGRVLGKQNMPETWQEALRCHRNALQIFRNTYEEMHGDVGASHLYIAEAHQALKQRTEAKAAYETALEIFLRVRGPEHPLCRQIHDALSALLPSAAPPPAGGETKSSQPPAH